MNIRFVRVQCLDFIFSCCCGIFLDVVFFTKVVVD